jgi:ATP-dependent DNA helicase PIF1
MTGAAAYLIHGKTVHSWSGIGLGKGSFSNIVKKICKTRRHIRERWKSVRVLIIDEISMMDCDLFDKLDEVAQTIRSNYLPWGGIQLCLFGDMCQLPPCVDKKSSRIQENASKYIDVIATLTQFYEKHCPRKAKKQPLKLAKKWKGNYKALFQGLSEKYSSPIKKKICEYANGGGDKFIFESARWKHIIKNTIHLTEIKRQENKMFGKCLNEMRLGIISPESKALLEKCHQRKWDKDAGIIPTRLYSYNRVVDETNSRELNKLIKKTPGIYQQTYRCKTNHEVIGNNRFNKKQMIVLSELMDAHLPYSYEITLAVGAQVMLLINMDMDCGLVNGSRGVVIGFSTEGLPTVQFLHGTVITMGVHEWKREDKKIIIIKKQIPLKLAWACTIHKIQGATLDYAEIAIKNIFEYGQAYVALSRVRDPSGLFIKDYDVSKIRCHPKVLRFYKSLE